MKNLIFFTILYHGISSLYAGVKYADLDISCPNPSDTINYITVPMFHDLKESAEISNIHKLNLHEGLQEQYKGKKFNIYYELLAAYDQAKELLIMIPGGPGESHTFIHSLEELQSFNEIKKKFNVLVMDHRGVGCSRYSGPGEYPAESLLMRQAASDIELIRKSFGINQQINVWGYSYGSMLAQTYALLYPHHLSKLFLGGAFSAASDFVDAMKTFEQRVLNASPDLLENYTFLKLFYPEYADKLLKIAQGYMYKYTLFKNDLVKLAQDVVQKLKVYDFKKADELLLDENQFVMEWMMRSISCIEIFPNMLADDMFPLFWENFSTCREFNGRTDYFDYTEDLINIKVPTFIWGGAFDHVTTAVAMRKMSEVIPNNFLYIDQHIGHGVSDKLDCFIEMMNVFFQLGSDKIALDEVKAKNICADPPRINTENEDGKTGVSIFGIF